MHGPLVKVIKKVVDSVPRVLGLSATTRILYVLPLKVPEGIVKLMVPEGLMPLIAFEPIVVASVKEPDASESSAVKLFPPTKVPVLVNEMVPESSPEHDTVNGAPPGFVPVVIVFEGPQAVTAISSIFVRRFVEPVPAQIILNRRELQLFTVAEKDLTVPSAVKFDPIWVHEPPPFVLYSTDQGF